MLRGGEVCKTQALSVLCILFSNKEAVTFCQPLTELPKCKRDDYYCLILDKLLCFIYEDNLMQHHFQDSHDHSHFSLEWKTLVLVKQNILLFFKYLLNLYISSWLGSRKFPQHHLDLCRQIPSYQKVCWLKKKQRKHRQTSVSSSKNLKVSGKYCCSGLLMSTGLTFLVIFFKSKNIVTIHK